jgi:hypothetical protein
MTRSGSQIQHSIKRALYILRTDHEFFKHGDLRSGTHQESLHHSIGHLVTNVVYCSAPLSIFATGSAVFLESLDRSVEYLVWDWYGCVGGCVGGWARGCGMGCEARPMSRMTSDGKSHVESVNGPCSVRVGGRKKDQRYMICTWLIASSKKSSHAASILTPHRFLYWTQRHATSTKVLMVSCNRHSSDFYNIHIPALLNKQADNIVGALHGLIAFSS